MHTFWQELWHIILVRLVWVLTIFRKSRTQQIVCFLSNLNYNIFAKSNCKTSRWIALWPVCLLIQNYTSGKCRNFTPNRNLFKKNLKCLFRLCNLVFMISEIGLSLKFQQFDWNEFGTRKYRFQTPKSVLSANFTTIFAEPRESFVVKCGGLFEFHLIVFQASCDIVVL